MARSGQVRVSITGDASGLKRSVAESETAIGRLNAAARNARSSLDSAGIAGVALGSAMGTLAANAAPMVIDQFKKAVSGAIDLGEQTSKATVIFREQGRAVVDWSDDLAKSFGVSEVAALKAAGEFGNMLVPMGILPAKAADMSRSMVQLAGDMASFNNASPQETLEALRSGLAGESEPLRRFGVFLSDARIKQEALNLHLSDGHGQLTASQKALATYAVIMKDTTNAQGDFSRTSDSLANRQRALQAQWDNVTAKIGTAMLPVISKLADGLTNVVNTMEAFHIPEAFQKFMDFMNTFSNENIAGGIRSFGGGVRDVVSGAVGSVFGGLGFASGGVVPGTPPAVPGVDNLLAMVRSREVILTEPMQHDLGMARVMDVVRRHGGVTGGHSFARGGQVASERMLTMSGAQGFAIRVLNILGIPVTPEAVRMILAWIQSETGLNQWNRWNNPLNFKMRSGLTGVVRQERATDGGTFPVFDSAESGAQGTALVLGQDIYSGIRSALQSGNYGQFSSAVAGSQWGTVSVVSARSMPLSYTGGGGGGQRPRRTTGGNPTTAPGVPSGGQAVSAASAFAEAHLGQPYSQARRNSGTAWDCSSFAIAVAKAAGANVTSGGTTATAWQESTPVSGAVAQSAPLVWGFYNSGGYGAPMDGGNDEHMGVRINGVWYDASWSAGKVRKNGVSESFWNRGLRVPRGLEAGARQATPPSYTYGSQNQVVPASPVSVRDVAATVRAISGGNPVLAAIVLPGILSALQPGGILSAMQATAQGNVQGAGDLLSSVTQMFGLRTAVTATSLSNIFRNAGASNPKAAANLIRSSGADIAGMYEGRAQSIGRGAEAAARRAAGQQGRSMGLSPSRIRELQDAAADKARANTLRQQIRVIRQGIRAGIAKVGQLNQLKAQLKPGASGYRKALAQTNASIKDVQNDIDRLQADEDALVSDLQDLGEDIEAADYSADWARANRSLPGPSGATRGLTPGTGRYDPNADSRRLGGPAGSNRRGAAAALPNSRPPSRYPAFATTPGGGGTPPPGSSEPAEPPAPPSLGELLPALQADIRKNWSLAQLSGDKAQQIAVAQSAVAVYGQIFAMAVDIGDPGLIADAADTLKSWKDTLANLQQATDPSNDPDLQAQLAQANQRAATNLRAFNLSNAFIHTALGPGDLGRGGASAWGAAGGSIGAPQVVIQSLTPADPTTLGIIASTVARAQAGQGFVPTSALSLGV